MKEFEILIDTPRKEYKFELIPENPFIKVLNIQHPDGRRLDSFELGGLRLDRKYSEGRVRGETLDHLTIPFDLISLIDVYSLVVSCPEESVTENPIKITYVNQNIRGLNASSEWFEEKFTSPNNRRMFLSGKFGSGKSTFLNYYFDKNEDKYNVFRINPVHYSIATNQDIFRFVKADLLFQLLSIIPKDTLMVNKVSIIEHLSWEFYNGNFLKSLGKYALLLSNLGKHIPSAKAKLFFGSMAILQSFTKDIIGDIEKDQKDEFKLIEDFFKELENQEGGLYEYNAITKIIEQLLSIVSENSSKQNVLIIDDLDRIDPDHIFRILNIISAHFDSSVNDELEKDKFGFDKIIVVADRDNIEGIYRHRFGANVDFEGYIEKLSGKSPYMFNNDIAVLEIIEDITSQINDNPRSRVFYEDVRTILLLFLESNTLSIREIVRLSAVSLDRAVEVAHSISTSGFISVVDVVLYYFAQVWKLKTLKSKLIAVKNKNITQPFNRTHALRMIACLGETGDPLSEGSSLSFEFDKSRAINYSLLEGSNSNIYIANILDDPNKGSFQVGPKPYYLTKNDLNWNVYVDIFQLQIDRFQRSR
jgi:hypothetical protein